MATPTKSKKRSFAESLGNELFTIILSPSTSATPKKYQIHANKLREGSDFFAGVLDRFMGMEGQVELSKGYEDMEEAFEGFIEWLYSGDYARGEHTDMVFEARMVAVAHKLKSKELKVKATDSLEKILVDFDVQPQRFVYDAVPENLKALVKVIRIVYENTERPYTGRNLSTTSTKTTEIPELKKVDHKNCRARKITAKCAARRIFISRTYKCFHELVEEFGEFASDLLLEEVSTFMESNLVKVVSD